MKKEILIWQKVDNLEIALIGLRKIDKLLINNFSCKAADLPEFYKKFNLEKLPTTLIIPRNLVIVRFLEVPSINQDEISPMVEFQAIRELPFSKEEIVLGYRILGSFREGYSTIMLAILNRELAEKSIRFIEESDGSVSGLGLSTEYLYLWAIEDSVIKTKSTAMLLELYPKNLELLVISNKIPIFSRTFSDEERLVEELGRSILAYKKERLGPDIEEIVLTGIVSNLGDFSNMISKSLEIPTRVYAYNKNRFLLKEAPQIELLPKALREKRAKAANKKNLIFSACLAAAFILLLFGIFSLRMYEKSKFLTLLDAKIKEIHSEANEVEAMLRKTEVIKSQIKNSKVSLDILAELYRIMPEEIYLSSLGYEEGRQVILKGLSKNMQGVFMLIKTLEDSKYFKKVELKFASSRKVAGQEMTDFQIICGLEKR